MTSTSSLVESHWTQIGDNMGSIPPGLHCWGMSFLGRGWRCVWCRARTQPSASGAASCDALFAGGGTLPAALLALAAASEEADTAAALLFSAGAFATGGCLLEAMAAGGAPAFASALRLASADAAPDAAPDGAPAEAATAASTSGVAAAEAAAAGLAAGLCSSSSELNALRSKSWKAPTC